MCALTRHTPFVGDIASIMDCRWLPGVDSVALEARQENQHRRQDRVKAIGSANEAELDWLRASLTKRLLVGRPLRSARLGETLLPKRLALPVFCSNPLSSNAYATEEILRA